MACITDRESLLQKTMCILDPFRGEINTDMVSKFTRKQGLG